MPVFFNNQCYICILADDPPGGNLVAIVAYGHRLHSLLAAYSLLSVRAVTHILHY